VTTHLGRWVPIWIPLVVAIATDVLGASVGDPLPNPPFEEYSVVDSFKGRPAPVDLSSDPKARRYRTMLREGAAEGPNFAGHYTVVTWGCGTECQVHSIVDARTGRVYMFPFVTGYDLAFRRDSRLLVADAVDECLDPQLIGPDESTWYVWNEHTLKRIGAVRIVAPCALLYTLPPDPPENCIGAEKRSYQLRSWSAVYAYFRDYKGWCIDGALGEGVSESVTRLLDERWSAFGDYAKLAQQNPKFSKWVVGELEGYENECAIVHAEANLTLKCPKDARALCEPLVVRAQEVITPEDRTHCASR
jgi:hypothetical protein